MTALIHLTSQNTQNFELVKLLSDNGDINKVIKDKVTSKNYYHHTLHIVSNGFISNKNTIIPILNYLNSNEYFQEIQGRVDRTDGPQVHGRYL